MAPGLGLYLDELFFHGYNVKQQRENERDSNRAKKTEEEKLETAEVALNSNEDVVRNEEEPADKKQRIDDEDAKDDDPDTVIIEKDCFC